MELGLAGKAVLVAGSSRGIGLAVARAFLAEGAKVAITGRTEEALLDAAASLRGQPASQRVLPLCGDMTDAGDVRRVLDDVVASFGGLDIAVANVGSGSGRPGWDLAPEDWGDAFQTNLLGGMTFAAAAIPHLSRAGGCLVFIASIAGMEALNAPLPYSAAKAALLNASKNLSRALAGQGVRVNAVAPGNILFPGGSWEKKLAERREFFERFIQDEVPLRRFGRPEEVADAVIFLASERAAFITGACLVVDGGQTRASP